MRVSVRELKNRLSEYLRLVDEGEEIIVTSHKRAVARLVPIQATAEDPASYSPATMRERLEALPWLHWPGDKPQVRRATSTKPGKPAIADILLEDRR